MSKISKLLLLDFHQMSSLGLSLVSHILLLFRAEETAQCLELKLVLIKNISNFKSNNAVGDGCRTKGFMCIGLEISMLRAPVRANKLDG